MKLHEIRRSSVTGNALEVVQAASSVVFAIPVPAEGIVRRFSLAAETTQDMPTITGVNLYDDSPSGTNPAFNHASKVIPAQTSAPVQYIGQAAYSLTSRRAQYGGQLYVEVTAGSNIPAGAKFALSLVIQVGGAIM